MLEQLETIAIQSPGDMGHGVGAFLGARGLRVVTSLAGRSEGSHARAKRAGMQDVGSLDALVREADLVLSILPPSLAPVFAGECAAAMRRTGQTPLFADCNAVSPQTAHEIEKEIAAAGAPFVDGGIIGGAPAAGRPATRLYVSGARAAELEALSGECERGALDVRGLGSEVGRASGLKMVYAALTKGTMTLQTAVLVAAERLGLLSELERELDESQAQARAQMRRIAFLPADSARWIGEMQEIAATFRGAGVPAGFHEGAEQIFRLMARTPFAKETRETLDLERTLEEAIRVFAGELD